MNSQLKTAFVIALAVLFCTVAFAATDNSEAARDVASENSYGVGAVFGDAASEVPTIFFDAKDHGTYTPAEGDPIVFTSLNDAIASEYGSLIVIQCTMTLDGDLTVSKDITIAASATVGLGGKLTVPEGKTFTIDKDGVLDVFKYTVTVAKDGSLVNNGNINVSGNFNATTTGTGKVNAVSYFIVGDTATYTSASGTVTHGSGSDTAKVTADTNVKMTFTVTKNATKFDVWSGAGSMTLSAIQFDEKAKDVYVPSYFVQYATIGETTYTSFFKVDAIADDVVKAINAKTVNIYLPQALRSTEFGESVSIVTSSTYTDEYGNTVHYSIDETSTVNAGSWGTFARYGEYANGKTYDYYYCEFGHVTSVDYKDPEKTDIGYKTVQWAKVNLVSQETVVTGGWGDMIATVIVKDLVFYPVGDVAVEPMSITVPTGSTITVEGKTLTVAGKTVTAVSEKDVAWEVVSGSIVSEDMKIRVGNAGNILVMDQYGVWQVISAGSNATVWTALDAAANAGVIMLDASESSYGHYVKGINGLAGTSDYSYYWALYTYDGEKWTYSETGVDTTSTIGVNAGLFYVGCDSTHAVIEGGPVNLADKIPAVNDVMPFDAKKRSNNFGLVSASGFATGASSSYGALLAGEAIAELGVPSGSWVVDYDNSDATVTKMVYSYASRSGVKTTDFSVTKESDVATAWAAAEAAVKAWDGKAAMGGKFPYKAVEYDLGEGVKCAAEVGTLSNSYFVMFAINYGDFILHGYTEGKYLYVPIKDSVESYLASYAAALKLASSMDIENLTVLDAFKHALDTFDIPYKTNTLGVDTIYGMWSSSDSIALYDDFENPTGWKYTYWIQYVYDAKTETWSESQTAMGGLPASENPMFKLAVGDRYYYLVGSSKIAADIEGCGTVTYEITDIEGNSTPTSSAHVRVGTGILVSDNTLTFYCADGQYTVMTATPAEGFKFVKWLLDGEEIEDGDYIMSDSEITAVFENAGNILIMDQYGVWQVISAGNNTTVWAALDAAAKAGTVVLDVSEESWGHYVKGINGLAGTADYTYYWTLYTYDGEKWTSSNTGVDTTSTIGVNAGLFYVGYDSTYAVKEGGPVNLADKIPAVNDVMPFDAKQRSNNFGLVSASGFAAGASSSYGALLAGEALTTVKDLNGSWSVDYDNSNAAKAVMTYSYYNSSCKARTATFTITKESDLETAWAAAEAAVKAWDGQAAMGGKFPYKAVEYDLGEDVKCVAEVGTLSNAYFVMFAINYGDFILHGYTKSNYLYVLSDDSVKDYLASYAAALKLASSMDVKDLTMMAAFEHALQTFDIPYETSEYGVKTIYGLWDSTKSTEIKDYFGNVIGTRYTYWAQYYMDDEGNWKMTEKTMPNMPATEYSVLKIAVTDTDYYPGVLADVPIYTAGSGTITIQDENQQVVDKAQGRVGAGIFVDPENGAIIGIQTEEKKGYIITAAPAEGYTFAGWYADGVLLKSGDIFTEETILVAYFKTAAPAADIEDAGDAAAAFSYLYKDGTNKNSTWTVKDGATSVAATLVHTYKNTSDKDRTETVTVTVEKDIDAAYDAAVAQVFKFTGTTTMDHVYTEVTAQIDGVKYYAITAQLSGSSFTKFVMAAGDLLIVGNDKYCYLVGADTTNGVKELLQNFADITAKKNVYRSVEISAGEGGSVDKSGKFTAIHGEPVVIKDNVLTIGDLVVTATANAKTAEETYSFNSWTVTGFTDRVSDNGTIVAGFEVTVTPKADESGTVDVDVSGKTESKVDVLIPSDAKKVEVKFNETSSAKVDNASDLAGKKVEVGLTEAKGEYKGKAYEFTFAVDGSSYTGKMDVTLPYTEQSGKNPVVYFVDDNGNYVKMNTSVNKDGTLTFSTEHNSVYVVVMESPEKANNYAVFAVAMVFVVILLAIAIYGIARRPDEY